MEILDPEGLREGSCECYELMEAQFNRIFEKPWFDLARDEDQR